MTKSDWSAFADRFANLGPIHARRDNLESELCLSLLHAMPTTEEGSRHLVESLARALRATLRLGLRVAEQRDLPSGSLIQVACYWQERLREALPHFDWTLTEPIGDAEEAEIITEATNYPAPLAAVAAPQVRQDEAGVPRTRTSLTPFNPQRDPVHRI
jgi:hypothetical protein